MKHILYKGLDWIGDIEKNSYMERKLKKLIREKKGTDAIFEEVMNEYFPKLIKNKNL